MSMGFDVAELLKEIEGLKGRIRELHLTDPELDLVVTTMRNAHTPDRLRPMDGLANTVLGKLLSEQQRRALIMMKRQKLIVIDRDRGAEVVVRDQAPGLGLAQAARRRHDERAPPWSERCLRSLLPLLYSRRPRCGAPGIAESSGSMRLRCWPFQSTGSKSLTDDEMEDILRRRAAK